MKLVVLINLRILQGTAFEGGSMPLGTTIAAAKRAPILLGSLRILSTLSFANLLTQSIFFSPSQ
jgi:hypothetical protein